MRRFLPVSVLAAAALVYPLIVLAGGAPHFPDRGECIHAAKEGEPIEAVFGRFSERAAADEQLRQVLAVGFEGAKIELDGCGVLKVVVEGIPTLAVGRDFVAEARRVDFQPTLEQGTP
jgi:hypothetical protein